MSNEPSFVHKCLIEIHKRKHKYTSKRVIMSKSSEDYYRGLANGMRIAHKIITDEFIKSRKAE